MSIVVAKWKANYSASAGEREQGFLSNDTGGNVNTSAGFTCVCMYVYICICTYTTVHDIVICIQTVQCAFFRLVLRNKHVYQV